MEMTTLQVLIQKLRLTGMERESAKIICMMLKTEQEQLQMIDWMEVHPNASISEIGNKTEEIAEVRRRKLYKRK